MKSHTIRTMCLVATLAAWVIPAGAAAPEPQMSPRMEKAKDFIADEQWLRAIEALKAAAADTKEKNQDEALFWLAHSQHQVGDLSDALMTIGDLERKFPASRWVRPARSLRVELAQKLRRDDFLWRIATPAPPPPMPAPAAPVASTPTAAGARTPPPPRAPRRGMAVPTPAEAPRGALPPEPPTATPAPPPAPRVRPAAAGGRRSLPPPTPSVWVSEYTVNDTDLRIQALGSLMPTDAPRVIPILRAIALDSSNPNEASRAVFVLAQSGRPEAHLTVLEVAKVAPEPVSVAAVRELGRFGGPRMSDELLKVYEAGKPRVKYQVVTSLGERFATGELLRIVQSESDSHLREAAIVTLGRAGGRQQLYLLYRRANPEAKAAIIRGLFNARAETELIDIAKREKDSTLRLEVLKSLRLLGTPKAKEYLEKEQTSR